jgi:hypothetical protein
MAPPSESNPEENEALEPWTSWRRACAADLCPPEHRRALHEFAARRAETWLHRSIGRTCLPTVDPARLPPAQCWHLLESHLAVNRTRAGKRYKDWIFERSQGAGVERLDAILSGAALILRDAVRAYLHREFSRAGTLSLDQPVAGHETLGLILGDLLADGNPDHFERRDLESLARELASSFVETLDAADHILLFARAAGIALSHPAVRTASGLGRSALHARYVKLVARVGEIVGDRFEEEDRETRVQLGVLTIEELKKIIILSRRPEFELLHFFQEKEGTDSHE